MFTTTLLVSVAFAHTQLFVPAPRFLSPAENNFPSECNQITFTNNAPEVNINTFTTQLNAKFGGSLLAYFKACGSDSPKTDHNGQAPIPADGMVKIDSHSQHPGLYEFYIDDTKVAGGTWQVGQTPDTLPIDFSKCAGTCKFRYMMAAVHQQPIQLYDNIVTLTGSAPASAPAVPPASAPAPPPASSPAPASGNSPAPPPSTQASGEAQQYEQCGGTGFTGPTTCAVGLTCQVQNDYYSQCLTSDAPLPPNTAAQYEQCGGEGFTGPTNCAAGLTCQVQNDYYSQCLRVSNYRRR